MSERTFPRSVAPRPARTPRPRALATALVGSCAALLLTGCLTQSAEDAENADATLPENTAEGYERVPVYMVALSGEYPPNTTGRLIGCDDLAVQVRTVPVETEDTTATAVDFLLDDGQYEHGDPAVVNALDASEDDLTYNSHAVEGDTVTVELEGDVVSRSQCESFRIRAQLHETATENAGVGQAEILVNGTDLDTLLGLPPYVPGEEITTDDGGSPGPGGGTEPTEAPGIPPGDETLSERPSPPQESASPAPPT